METDDTRNPFIPRNDAPERAVEHLPSAEVEPRQVAAYAEWRAAHGGDQS